MTYVSALGAYWNEYGTYNEICEIVFSIIFPMYFIYAIDRQVVIVVDRIMNLWISWIYGYQLVVKFWFVYIIIIVIDTMSNSCRLWL